MAQLRQPSQNALNGVANGRANGYANGSANGHANGHIKGHSPSPNNQKTDRSRWRLLDESGRHTWHYLKTDKELEEWPQTTADKYHLGLQTVGASLAEAQAIYTNWPRTCPTSLLLRNPPSQ
jgi:hypothetical protein